MSSSTPKDARTRAPRGTLSQHAIVEAAIGVVDRDGLAAVTTRRLADELGVRPMSLYTHFRDKDAILAAVAAELLGRIDWPEPVDDDVEWLRQMMRAYFRLLITYPVLLELDVVSDGTSETEARLSEEIYARLQQLHVDHRQAVGMVASLMRFVVGSAMFYRTRRAWDEDPDHWERVRLSLARLPAEVYPAVHALTTDFPVFSQWDVFEFGLDLLLSPLAAGPRSRA